MNGTGRARIKEVVLREVSLEEPGRKPDESRRKHALEILRKSHIGLFLEW
jgi:hypothetical protein